MKVKTLFQDIVQTYGKHDKERFLRLDNLFHKESLEIRKILGEGADVKVPDNMA